MHSIKILFTYVQLILYRYRISCIYTFSFIVGVLGYTPNTHLWYELSGRQHPNLRAVITALAKEKNNRYALYNQNKAWELPDFITIYTHPNEYIEEVMTFLSEPDHTTKEYLIVQHMMELLSAQNYALFLEACAQAYIEKKMSTRMLIEITRPIRWNIRSRHISWRPGYFLVNYKKSEVQAILHRIRQNTHLPIYFKKCIADVASGKAYKQLAGEFWYTSKYRPTFFIE